MLIYDREKLLKILKDFHMLTSATISIWDSDFNQILVYPENAKELCRRIKQNPCGNSRCFASDKGACMRAVFEESPYSFTCHAGLLDTAIPVRYEGEVLAYIMFGQIRDAEQRYVNFDNVKKLCSQYGLSEEETEKYYNMLPVLSHSQISAAASVLSMSTIYLHVSQAIKIERNELVSGIDNYISENISQPVTVCDLCEKFGISQNKLYSLSHKYFQMSIGNYITLKKIALAKHLLTTTHSSISMISEQVGFPDYNYFIRKFKTQTGTTPLAYRKSKKM